jgi:pimeloyl-ACP methyl ester carboxylesterase
VATGTIRVSSTHSTTSAPEAAAIIERIRTYGRGGYAADAEDLQAEFTRVCYPLYSAGPGWAEESRRFLARMIRNPDVAAHYDSREVLTFDPSSLLDAVRCPVLLLAGEDDPVCPLLVEELASQLPADTTRLVGIVGRPLRASSEESPGSICTQTQTERGKALAS